MKRLAFPLLLGLGAACAGGPRPSNTPAPTHLTRQALTFAADSIAATPIFRTAHWGMLIVDPATGDTLLSRNAGKYFMPASNQKILTGATALAQLGPDFTFKTRFHITGTVTDGVLSGDLLVEGRGDPSFSDAMRGDYRRAFREMADSVAAHGIREIAGDVVAFGNAFPDSSYGFGWQIDDLTESYGAVVDELFVNEGFLKGRAANAKGDSVDVEVPIREPATVFLATLRQALAERRIVVRGRGTASAQPKSVTVGSTTYVPVTEPLFTLVSPPLRTILPVMEKPSQNQIAEILFKTLGLEKTGVGTADSARRVVERQLIAWGAQPDGFAVRDGSGLSRHDYVTPETIAKALDAMRTDPNFKVFYDALPIAGVDGTIGARMKGTPAQGNVHAKTGSVDKARSLSGYVTTADGRLLIFSFLCNNFSGSSRDVEKATDALLARIAGSPFATR